MKEKMTEFCFKWEMRPDINIIELNLTEFNLMLAKMVQLVAYCYFI